MGLEPVLTLLEAHHILKQFDGVVQKAIDTEAEREQLRQALLRVVAHSDYQILGICADSIAEGQQALAAYAAALGHTPQFNLAAIDGAVYMKFNPKTGLCYASPYRGEHRGVLVSCQSEDAVGFQPGFAQRLSEMYGHLPIDLFDC